MTREILVTMAAITGFLMVALVLSVRDRRNQEKWFLAKAKRLWGSVSDREYTGKELDSISHYAKKHQGERFMIDDITWNDLNMDQLFVTMNTTLSSCGEDVLYSFLRLPEFHSGVLEERERLMTYFAAHEKERLEVQRIVKGVRKMSELSLADYIYVLKDADTRGAGKYIALACGTVAAIGTIFLAPLQGILFLIAMLSVNAIVHTRDAKKIETYLNCFICILRLLKAADRFRKVNNPQIQGHLDRIRKSAAGLQGFRRGAFLVAATDSMQDGLDAFILSYLKIMFFVDLIKFHSMLKSFYGHEQEIDELFTAMGELDALIAAASFREYLPYYCLPRFREPEARKKEEAVYLEAVNLYHPLIPDPVCNSVNIHGGILVTGSNASGKSTFLKTVAVNAILAQSVMTCVCTSYQADYLKVMTSMALRDDLESGESYYMVEIRSLQRILLECQKETPVLCIVDEVLRGTNTIERIAASSRILASLAQPQVLPLAATHDIELSYILEKIYTNYHFEEEIREKDVCFNYLLKEGRATTRNAIRLLEIIGYDPAIIEDARQAAQDFEETGNWNVIEGGTTCL